jgi:hypothetical protein
MIEISDGFTSISAGSDSIEALVDRTARRPTGARVTLEFRRQRALAPGQCVTVRYDFAGDGTQRQGTGIARPIQSEVRSGLAVVYHYRLSYWIAAGALSEYALGNVRYRTEEPEIASQPLPQQTLLIG